MKGKFLGFISDAGDTFQEFVGLVVKVTRKFNGCLQIEDESGSTLFESAEPIERTELKGSVWCGKTESGTFEFDMNIFAQ